MTLWGSSVGPLSGRAGDGLVAQPPLPGFNPLRLEANGLIDVPARPPMRGGDQHNDRPTGPFLVTLSPITLPNGRNLAFALGNEAQVFDYAAVVKWGRGGQNMVAIVDWPASGGSFVVSGDSIYVDAWALIPLSGIFDANFVRDGLLVRLGASATPISGPRPGVLPPRRTMYLPTPIAAPAGTSGDIFVPPFARRMDLQMDALPDTNWLIRFLYRRFFATFAQDFYAGTIGGVIQRKTLDNDPIDIPTTATSVVVNNTSGGGGAAPTIVNGALVFDLDLG